ncbi:phage head-tail connector protein [Sporosarcina sp. resist]|uniref:phage head-tail connector protein n=1 Tax=Sporosarcina sp. resist TaxID=2762563 RepID=UPI00164EC053|nr:phage head-tail connector protein [Sporosarcina sp. resist]QNK86432.1 phage head-tail connector protein [Sporosarcina sp. resist]
MRQIDKLKLQLGIINSEQDDLLELSLEDIKTDILTWTNRTALPKSLESTCRQIAVIHYNKQGVEGQTSHSEGGISRSFEDLPQSLQSTINQKRLAKLARYAT